MKIPQKIKLTISYNDENFDMEIPTELTIKETKKRLVSVLNQYYKGKGKSANVPEAINIYFNNEILDDDKLLINYGIWSGSLISMR